MSLSNYCGSTYIQIKVWKTKEVFCKYVFIDNLTEVFNKTETLDAFKKMEKIDYAFPFYVKYYESYRWKYYENY